MRVWGLTVHGMDVKGYPYNDGTSGLTMGTQVTGTAYTYTLRAEPAGTSMYHCEYYGCDGGRD
jgi:FtsP/CotA-like multicopper oxidase with cupredoxin domain